MKKLILALGISILVGPQFFLFSQIPNGYYDSAEGLSYGELKTALYLIIKGHTEYPYTASYTDTWDILKESDEDPNNTDNVILFYTGWSVNADQEYNNGSGWNREHVWPKLRGDFGKTLGSNTDAHHLRPTDISVNFARNNRWFDNCTTPYLDDGLETGCFTSPISWVWQPREKVKGDVARMIFYMATRYEGENGEPDLEVIETLPSDDYTKEPVHAKLSTLLAWHQEDPVDSFEQSRNEVVYSYQGNRNPFIDHPDYVNKIWSTIPDGVIDNQVHDSFQLYTNPIKDVLTIVTNETGEYYIEITSISGEILYMNTISESTSHIDLSSFQKVIYFITIRSNEIVITKMIMML